jgi:hypothetical protein
VDSPGPIGKPSMMNMAQTRTGQLFKKSRIFRPLLFCFLTIFLTTVVVAQSPPYTRTFPKSKEEVNEALKDLRAYDAQKLESLEDFVAAKDEPLNRYDRAMVQFSINVQTGDPSGTTVRVTGKITAWYTDTDPIKSGYHELASNGRLELGLLDRLEEKLGGKPASTNAKSRIKDKLDPSLKTFGKSTEASDAPTTTESSSVEENADLASLRAKREAQEKRIKELKEEVENLKELREGQAHPLNHVAVKKDGTPVVSEPADGSKLLFNASANDEFELLDEQGEWIHVKISATSRGYVRRSDLELP